MVLGSGNLGRKIGKKPGFKKELFPGIPIQVFSRIKSPNLGNEAEKTGTIPQNSLQNQTLPLLSPNPDFPNPNPLFLKIHLQKGPKFPNSPIPADGKVGKIHPGISREEGGEKKLQKTPTVLPNFSIPPQIRGGGFLGRAGPGVPWLRPEENPGILLIQIRGIPGFFFCHQRSFLCRISQAILFLK